MGVVNVLEYVTSASTGNTTDFGDLSTTRDRVAGTSDNTRGVYGGGAGSGYFNVIDYITIASTGNTTDFGDLTAAKFSAATSGGHGGIS